MKKISHLLIGTNNKGKFKEIRALLPKYIKISSTSDSIQTIIFDSGTEFKKELTLKKIAMERKIQKSLVKIHKTIDNFEDFDASIFGT